jgi:hypothetical protein
VTDQSASYLSPLLEVRPLPGKGFFGVFAREAIQPGHLLALWCGYVLAEAKLSDLPEIVRSRSVQIEEGFYLVPDVDGEPADFINHSCNPNAGLQGQIALVALRPIQPGEEICYDYAMTDGSPYDEFECQCGEATCRHHVTGEDWRLPELQRRYAGYFSPYLQRRIERLKASSLSESFAQAAD